MLSAGRGCLSIGVNAGVNALRATRTVPIQRAISQIAG